jgi:CubicO group peptidase (beta-lactamase class C family)
MIGPLLALAAAMQPAPAALCRPATTAIDAAAQRTLAQGAPGLVVAVARDGRTVFARGYGQADLEHRAPVTTDTVFRLASITKQFTAAAVLRLVERGRLGLDDPLAEHLPGFPGGDRITLRHLLHQTSGVPDYSEDPAGSAGKAAAMTPEAKLAWISRLAATPAFEPGAKWAYSNSNYVLLGLVVERAAGRPLAQVFADELFRPAGLTRTAFDEPGDLVPNRARGYRKTEAGGFVNADAIHWTMPGAAGGLRSTAGDLVRWSDALFGGRVLRPESLALMTGPGRLADGRTTRWGMPDAWRIGMDADYALGVFFVTATPRGPRVWHGGDIDGFSTWLGHYPERRVTIALLQNSESADLPREAVERAVLDALDGRCG